jgi:arabinose-5-phosphate isomerase
MHAGDAMPSVRRDAAMPDVLKEISLKKLGMTCIVDEAGKLAGIVTDGDLRRHLTSGKHLLDQRASDVMTSHPVTVTPETLAAEALRILEERKITSLVVVDADRHVRGVVHLHDLWRTQMI